MNIASVPWRCGHSWTAPGEVGRLRVGRLGHQRPRRPRGVRRRGSASTASHHAGRLGDDGRAGRVEHHAARAAPSRARCPAAPAAAAPGRSRSVGRRRQRLSGRRRSAPRPEHGASTSTRSKRALGPRRPGPVTRRRRRPSVARSAWATSRARCGCRSLASSRAPRCVASAASRAALPPGPAHRSSQRSSRPSTAARARARATSWDPASWTPARPSRTAGIAPGSPDSRTTPSGEMPPPVEPVEPRLSTPSSATVDSPGRATSVTRGRSLSAASSASSSSGRPARGPARRRPTRGARTAPPSGRRASSIHASQVALGDPAHQGVGEARPACARPGADQLDGAGHRCVVGHAHAEQLMGAEAQGVADGRRRALRPARWSMTAS